MRIDFKFRAAALAVVAALALTACGGDSASETTESSEELIAPPVQEVQASGGFNSPVKIPSGVTFTLSEPISFKPGKFAAGQLPGQRYQELISRV
ncbi:MAG: hypothetical protein RI901_410 [Actinomycetota bacterium]